MILQEVLTSQHAAKRKSTLLVWPLVTERTWNWRALKRKITPCLKAIIGYCIHRKSYPSGNCQGLSTKKDVQKYPKKGATERPSYAREDFMLCFARCKNGRCSKEVRQTLQALKRAGVLSTELVCMADIGEWSLWLNPLLSISKYRVHPNCF